MTIENSEPAICTAGVHDLSRSPLRKQAFLFPLPVLEQQSLFDEGLISLTYAAKLPGWPNRRAGEKPHVSTLIRWALRGVGGVKLETMRCGRTLCTSKPAIV